MKPIKEEPRTGGADVGKGERKKSQCAQKSSSTFESYFGAVEHR